MIKRIHIKNFRAIERAEIELGKITVLTGANNSGKSSVIYSLLALKNVVSNPAQNLDSFVNLPFLNLGGFSQTVFLKNEDLNIELGIDVLEDDINSKYLASIGKKQSELRLDVSTPYEISLSLEVAFPYATNLKTGYELKLNSNLAKIAWNGISPTINIEGGEAENENKEEDILNKLNRSLNAPIEALRGVDFIPLRRGFIKPIYSSVPMRAELVNDEELATLLATDRDLEGKVSFYLEKIVDRIFTVRPTIGTANFNLQSRDHSTGFVCDLVNEGFGTNQLVNILTKALRNEMSSICIEELEIHLHPELMDGLIEALVEIVHEEQKQFIISTHSEHIVLSLLNKVASKKMKPDDLVLYYFAKERKKAKIEKQEVNEKGQTKGGLKGFYETELKQVRDFFKIGEAE